MCLSVIFIYFSGLFSVFEWFSELFNVFTVFQGFSWFFTFFKILQDSSRVSCLFHIVFMNFSVFQDF